MVLRALFRPPQSTSVQKAVAPLLDAEEEVLREKAAAVLGKVRIVVGLRGQKVHELEKSAVFRYISTGRLSRVFC